MQTSKAAWLSSAFRDRAREGRGATATIVAYRSGDRAFFLYGFGKNARANIDDDEAEALEEYGSILLQLRNDEIVGLIAEGKLRRLER